MNIYNVPVNPTFIHELKTELKTISTGRCPNVRRLGTFSVIGKYRTRIPFELERRSPLVELVHMNADGSVNVLRVPYFTGLVSQDADPYDRISEIVTFVNYALTECAYTLEELPQDAVRTYYADYYLAQVLNGGHAQFVGNSHWTERHLVYIEQGLAAIGLTEAMAVFARLRAMPARYGLDFTRDLTSEDYDLTEVEFKELDSIFFERLQNQILHGLSDWIITWPTLLPAQTAELSEYRKRLLIENPNGRQRREKAERDKREAFEATGLPDLVRYVCQVSVRNARLKEITGYQVFFMDGFCPEVQVMTDRGAGKVLVLKDRAMLYLTEDHELAPQEFVPMSMIQAYLSRMGKQYRIGAE